MSAESGPRLTGPAYRIETARTRLRCFSPSDARSLTLAITQSLDHLRPWMPWAAHEPLPFEERVLWLRTQRGNFDLGAELTMGIFTKDESQVLGGTGLVRGGIDERELGYWIHVDHEGKGLATEVSAALLRVAFVLESLETVEIRCLRENQKSARIPLKLGFSGPYVDPLSFATADGDKRDVDVYTLSRVEYAHSPAARAQIEAYDVLDRRLI